MNSSGEHWPIWKEAIQKTTDSAKKQIRKAWKRAKLVPTKVWAPKYRILSSEESARPGRYSDEMTPWVRGIEDAIDDPDIPVVACMKSAQIAWTTIVLNWLGKIMHTDPSPVIGLFSKEKAAKEFREEKLTPMIRATAVLSKLVNLKTRTNGQTWDRIPFVGGFIKLVGSNSPSNVKSTPSPRGFVEEPDDASENVGKQGDSIALLIERLKTYDYPKLLLGGTPSIKDLSNINKFFLDGDQRYFMVPCHDCGETHALSWDNVKCPVDESLEPHEFYGQHDIDATFYACPCCGSVWDDFQKNKNIQLAEWVATKPFRGVASFYINELYAAWKGSRLARLMERHLKAETLADRGDISEQIVFRNSCLGLPYEYQGERLDTEALQSKELNYPEKTVYQGGLVLTAGVDIQHDRIAIIIRAWGRDEQSWLVWWGEIYGTTVDKKDKVWEGLEKILSEIYFNSQGWSFRVQAVSVDSSDGTTSDAVYDFVRTRQKRFHMIMAIKGSSSDYGEKEIFSKPKQSIDTKGKKHTKADKYGLRPYMVGTHKAKDLIHARLQLPGVGAARMHNYVDVRADYYDQITSNVKAPHKNMRFKKIWQPKAGAYEEGLDCEVYALHASRALSIHLWKASRWDAIEQKLSQVDLFSDSENSEEESAEPQEQKQVKKSKSKRRKKGGFAKSWR